MSEMQYRIGTVTFLWEPRPTWASRSKQILEAMALWGREGWTISRLNVSSCLRVGAQGFCLLLERPLSAGRSDNSRRVSRLKDPGMSGWETEESHAVRPSEVTEAVRFAPYGFR